MASQSLVEAEKLSLAKVARHCGNVHISTVSRWITKGAKGRKLPSIVVGGRRFVLREDLEAFLQEGRNPEDLAQERDAQSSVRAEAAGDELEELGF